MADRPNLVYMVITYGNWNLFDVRLYCCILFCSLKLICFILFLFKKTASVFGIRFNKIYTKQVVKLRNLKQQIQNDDTYWDSAALRPEGHSSALSCDVILWIWYLGGRTMFGGLRRGGGGHTHASQLNSSTNELLGKLSSEFHRLSLSCYSFMNRRR